MQFNRVIVIAAGLLQMLICCSQCKPQVSSASLSDAAFNDIHEKDQTTPAPQRSPTRPTRHPIRYPFYTCAPCLTTTTTSKDGWCTGDKQGSQVSFDCARPGNLPITDEPIQCVRDPECRVVAPVGISSGAIPDSAINGTSERYNYEAKNIRLNSATGWCAKTEAFSYVTVDLGKIHRIKVVLVKGVITNDVVGRSTEIRMFYKQKEGDNYNVYFPNFNFTANEPGDNTELAMITLPKVVEAQFVIFGIIIYDENPCLKFELMGCEDETEPQKLVGNDTGYPVCVENEPGMKAILW